MTDLSFKYRPLLLHIAYHMLGSMAAAEDVVQEVSERWLQLDHASIQSAKSYLSRMTTNRSMDMLRHLKAERAQYKGPWLPEPVIDPVWEPERQTLSLALLHLMERLDSSERAVYVLRVCFDWDYDAIAALLQKRSANCRQLLTRAKIKLQRAEAVKPINPGQLHQLSEAFFAASQNADFEALKKLFAPDINMYSDGGGKVTAARKPILGPEHCIRFLEGIQKQLSDEAHWEVKIIQGDWTLLIWEGAKLRSAMMVAWQGSSIYGLYAYLNPDKLALLVEKLAE